MDIFHKLGASKCASKNRVHVTRYSEQDVCQRTVPRHLYGRRSADVKEAMDAGGLGKEIGLCRRIGREQKERKLFV